MQLQERKGNDLIPSRVTILLSIIAETTCSPRFFIYISLLSDALLYSDQPKQSKPNKTLRMHYGHPRKPKTRNTVSMMKQSEVFTCPTGNWPVWDSGGVNVAEMPGRVGLTQVPACERSAWLG